MKRRHRVRSLFFLCACFSVDGASGVTAEDSLTPDVQKMLLEKAERWQLPKPVPDSRLVKIWLYRSESLDFYALGFIEPDTPHRAVVGFECWDLSQRTDSQEVQDVGGLLLADISPTSPFVPSERCVNFGLLTGVQLLRRGDGKLGLALIEKSLAQQAEHARSAPRSPKVEDPILLFARNCLTSALNEMTSVGPDHAAIKQRIERICEDQPELKSETTERVVAGLEANVAHAHPAAPGSVERAIDDYLESGGRGTGAMSGQFNTAERVLILRGFEAVPALLGQRHAKRFTNHSMQERAFRGYVGQKAFVSYPMNAGQVIDAYLARLANDDLGSHWLHPQWDYLAGDEAVSEWWRKASAVGEEEYVKTRTISLDGNGEATLSLELLLIARERYPALLPTVYQSVLGTAVPSWPVVDALAATQAISRDQQLILLQSAIATNHEAHRNTALGYLQHVDRHLADEQLIHLLDQAPSTPEGEYWRDQDTDLGEYVSQSVDPQVWRAFHGLLDRADLAMRMGLIDQLHPPHEAPPEILRSFQGIFLRFCGDTTVWDASMSEKYSGLECQFSYRTIAMRDFVHVHWARWLDLPLEPPAEGASAAIWTDCRAPRQCTTGLCKYYADPEGQRQVRWAHSHPLPSKDQLMRGRRLPPQRHPTVQVGLPGRRSVVATW